VSVLLLIIKILIFSCCWKPSEGGVDAAFASEPALAEAAESVEEQEPIDYVWVVAENLVD
jgi:hypothetical protein